MKTESCLASHIRKKCLRNGKRYAVHIGHRLIRCMLISIFTISSTDKSMSAPYVNVSWTTNRRVVALSIELVHDK